MHSKAGVEIEHSLDPPHLNRSLCAAMSRAKFSPDMFPGKTRREKSNLQDRFADDLSHRAQAEAAAILKEHRGAHSQITTMAAKAASAIPQCYMGNHGLCKRVSYICHGGADVRSKLKMSTDDEQTVLKLLDKRIGKEAMEKTKYGTSTQKSESMNHAFAMTNPNGTLTFSRNAESRDHSAVHLVNNGHANSIVKKMRICWLPSNCLLSSCQSP